MFSSLTVLITLNARNGLPVGKRNYIYILPLFNVTHNST